MALALLAGCAPTLIAPSVLRLPAFEPAKREMRIGVRSGPRASAAITNLDRSFGGDGDDFSVPNWSIAYDLAFTIPLNGVFALHAGGQGEFYYPFPIPALGGWAGVSGLWRFGRLGISPALAARFATMFGLGVPRFFSGASAGTGEALSGDFSLTLSATGDDTARLGFAPFVSVSYLPGHATPGPVWYAGGVFVVRVDKIEAFGGVARVILPDGRSWNVPLIGLRAGEN